MKHTSVDQYLWMQASVTLVATAASAIAEQIPCVEDRPEIYRGADVSEKKAATKVEKVSSSVFFKSLRPKFLDWEPPTDKQKALAVKARKDAKEAELKRVTDLAKKRDAKKEGARRR